MLALYIGGVHSMYFWGQGVENVWGIWGCKLAWKCKNIPYLNTSQWSIHSSYSFQDPWIFCNIFKSIQLMVGVCIIKVFDTIIVNAKTTFCFLHCIYPEACILFSRYITTRSIFCTKWLYANTEACFKPYIPFLILMLTYQSLDIFLCRLYCRIIYGS